MVGKIRLTTRQWGHIFLISGGSFFLLTIIEAGIFYLWMSQPLQGAVGLVLIFLDLIISLILGYQRYFQDELMLVLAQFRNLSPTHARDLEQLQVHNLYLQEVVKQLLLITKTMHTAIKQQQESELSKDELITNVSHDLRTPLTSILGFLGLIEQNSQTSVADMRKYVHIAYQKSRQLQSLVNDLFEYMRANTASTQLDYQRFDMIQMLEQLAAEFELQAQQAHVEIIVDSPHHSLPMRADTQKLGRVFNNLITNALQYGQGAQHIWLRAQDNQSEVWLQVANDGQTIAPEALNHIFERFYRSDHSRSPAHKGTGLGLAIAQSLVRMHGGRLSVHSNQQQTAFDIILPKNLSGDKGE